MNEWLTALAERVSARRLRELRNAAQSALVVGRCSAKGLAGFVHQPRLPVPSRPGTSRARPLRLPPGLATTQDPRDLAVGLALQCRDVRVLDTVEVITPCPPALDFAIRPALRCVHRRSASFPALGNQTVHSAREQQGAVQALHTIHSNEPPLRSRTTKPPPDRRPGALQAFSRSTPRKNGRRGGSQRR